MFFLVRQYNETSTDILGYMEYPTVEALIKRMKRGGYEVPEDPDPDWMIFTKGGSFLPSKLLISQLEKIKRL